MILLAVLIIFGLLLVLALVMAARGERCPVCKSKLYPELIPYHPVFQNYCYVCRDFEHNLRERAAPKAHQ